MHKAFVSFSQGSKKVPSHRHGQVYSPSGQVTFQSHLPDGQGIRQVFYRLNQALKGQTKTFPGPTDKLVFSDFSANQVYQISREVRESRPSGVGHAQRSLLLGADKTIADSGNENG